MKKFRELEVGDLVYYWNIDNNIVSQSIEKIKKIDKTPTKTQKESVALAFDRQFNINTHYVEFFTGSQCDKTVIKCVGVPEIVSTSIEAGYEYLQKYIFKNKQVKWVNKE